MSNSRTDPDLTKRRTVATVLSVVALVAVLAFTWWIDGRGDAGESTASAPSSSTAPLIADATDASASPTPKPSAPRSTSPRRSTAPSRSSAVPARVLDTLEQVDSGRWPEAANAPGTRGGDTFRNREGRLPTRTESGKRITYKEWDVNPKQRGRGRDAERIVTGSDGAAWYTDDHYRTFTQIRGPSA